MEPRLLAVLAFLSATAAAEQWEIITSVITDPPPAGVAVSIAGPQQQQFARPLPRTLDPHLLSDFHDALNVLQDLELNGNNTFTLTSEQARPSR